MDLLSEDDRNLKELTPAELDAAWDLWFDLAQATNDFDPPYNHGVLVPARWPPTAPGPDDGSIGRNQPAGGSQPAPRSLR